MLGISSLIASVHAWTAFPYCPSYPSSFSETSPLANISAGSVQKISGQYYISAQVVITDLKGYGPDCVKRIEQIDGGSGTFYDNSTSSVVSSTASATPAATSQSHPGYVLSYPHTFVITSPHAVGEYHCAPPVSLEITFSANTYGSIRLSTGCSRSAACPALCWKRSEEESENGGATQALPSVPGSVLPGTSSVPEATETAPQETTYSVLPTGPTGTYTKSVYNPVKVITIIKTFTVIVGRATSYTVQTFTTIPKVTPYTAKSEAPTVTIPVTASVPTVINGVTTHHVYTEYVTTFLEIPKASVVTMTVTKGNAHNKGAPGAQNNQFEVTQTTTMGPAPKKPAAPKIRVYTITITKTFPVISNGKTHVEVSTFEHTATRTAERSKDVTVTITVTVPYVIGGTTSFSTFTSEITTTAPPISTTASYTNSSLSLHKRDATIDESLSTSNELEYLTIYSLPDSLISQYELAAASNSQDSLIFNTIWIQPTTPSNAESSFATNTPDNVVLDPSSQTPASPSPSDYSISQGRVQARRLRQ